MWNGGRKRERQLFMISTEHGRAEPYIYRTEPNRIAISPLAKKIVPYRRGYVRLVLDTRTELEGKCTVRYGSVRIAHSAVDIIRVVDTARRASGKLEELWTR